MARQRKTAALVKRLLLFLAVASFGCTLAVRYFGGRSHATTAAQPAQPAQKPPPQPAFPNANPAFIPPPAIYSGPLFVLSQDYPTQMPTGRPDFLSMNFKADWKAYMMKVRDYCFEGSTGVDFRVEHNTVRKWFHIPWQNWPATRASLLTSTA